jgi:hypothetical protein
VAIWRPGGPGVGALSEASFEVVESSRSVKALRGRVPRFCSAVQKRRRSGLPPLSDATRNRVALRRQATPAIPSSPLGGPWASAPTARSSPHGEGTPEWKPGAKQDRRQHSASDATKRQECASDRGRRCANMLVDRSDRRRGEGG